MYAELKFRRWSYELCVQQHQTAVFRFVKKTHCTLQALHTMALVRSLRGAIDNYKV